MTGETNIKQVWPSGVAPEEGEMYPRNWRFLKVELEDSSVGYYELCRSGELPEDDIVLECGNDDETWNRVCGGSTVDCAPSDDSDWEVSDFEAAEEYWALEDMEASYYPDDDPLG